MTAVYIRLKYDDTLFANGIPTPSFIVRGKNNIYDPRDGSYSYKANSALCCADFLTNNIWGFRAQYGTTLPIEPLISAANLCDESTPTASGFPEVRYECNGAFTTDADRGTILSNMLSAGGGRLTDTGGQYVIQPAAWTSPTLNLGGNGLLPFRSFNGHEFVDFGTSSSLYAQGNWSAGAWIQLPANSATGCFISMCDAGSSSVSAAAPYLAMIVGGPLNYQVLYGHDYGSGGFITGHEYLTFNLSSIASDTWTYVGLSRDSTAKTVTLFTGDGTSITAIQTLSYVQTPGISSGIAHMTLGAIYSDVADGSLEQTVLLMQNGYMSDTVWSSTDHTAAMNGSPTATGLLIDCDLTQAAPVSVTSAGTLTSTLTGTTLVSGVGVPFLENATGPIKWADKVQGRDLYNCVRGSFTSPINAWNMTDYPAYMQDPDHGYSVDQNLLDDGGDRRYYSLDLPFTKSQSCAQRLAGIQLKRLRQQGQGAITAGLALYQAAALDILYASLPTLGWNYKLLEVTGVQFVMADSEDSSPTLGVQMSLHETDPSVYEWSLTEEQRTVAVNPPALTDQSSPGTATSVGMSSSTSTTLVSSDGVATARIEVTFTPPADGFVTAIECQYQLVGASEWTLLPDINPSSGMFYISDVVIGNSYNVQIQSVGVSGAVSGFEDVPGSPITVAGSNTSLATSSIAVPSGATAGQVLTVSSSGTFIAASPTMPSGTANEVLATPNEASGIASLRSLVIGDVPTIPASHTTGFAPSATTDTTNASNITSGTLPSSRLPTPTATTLGGVESIAPTTSKWISSISLSGVPSLTQPTASDISGLGSISTLSSTAFLSFAGTYSAASTYAVNQIVQYQSSLYVCLSASTGNTPAQGSSYWGLIKATDYLNVRDFGALGNATTDDTAAITSAINAANAAGGGTVFFPTGTYITQTQYLYSYVNLLGAREESTIIKLKAGTNGDVFQGSITGYTSGVNGATSTALVNVVAAANVGNNSGVTAFSIRNLTIDGNAANQTAYAAAIRVYGYGFRLQNLYIRNTWGDGIYLDWNPNSPSYFLSPNQLESQLVNLKIHTVGMNTSGTILNANAIGLRYGGGTDSQFLNIIVYQTALHGIHIGPNAAATQMHQVHVWGLSSGTRSTCCLVDGSIYATNCEFEGSYYTQLVLLTQGSFVKSSVLFSGSTTIACNSYGVQLGQLASDSTCPSWPGSYWQATPGNFSPASTDGVAALAFLTNLDCGIHDTFLGAFQCKNERNNQLKALIWQTPRAYDAPASNATLTQTSGGSLSAGTYYVWITYKTIFGETFATGPSNLTVTTGNQLVVTSPSAPTQVNLASTGGATLSGYNIYIGTSSSSSAAHLQTSSPIAIGTNYTQSSVISTTGATPNLSGNYSAAQLVYSGYPAQSDSLDVNNSACDVNYVVGGATPGQMSTGALSTYVITDGTHPAVEVNNSAGSFYERWVQLFGMSLQIFADWYGGTKVAYLDHLGTLYLLKSGIVLGSNTSAQSLAGGGTVTVYQSFVSSPSQPGNSTGFGANNTGAYHFGKIRLTASSAVTGLVLQAGLVDGTETTLVNESSYPMTFAASSSNVSIASFVLPAGEACKMIYNSGTSLWHPQSWNTYSGNIGIGTTSPAASLHVATSGASTENGIVSEQLGNTANAAEITLYKNRGTRAAPAAVQLYDLLGSVQFCGYDGTNDLPSGIVGSSIVGYTTQAWTSSAHGSGLQFETTPNGSSTPVAALILGSDQSATFGGVAAFNGALTTTQTVPGNSNGVYFNQTVSGPLSNGFYHNATLTGNGMNGWLGNYTFVNNGASQVQSGFSLVVTNAPVTNPNKLYAFKMVFTDATSLANTIYGVYVDVSVANSAATKYAAVFLNGNVGIGTSTPASLLSVGTAFTVDGSGNAKCASLDITAGTNTKTGSGTLVAGTVTVSNTSVTANSKIFLQCTNSSTTNVGALVVTAKTAGTSFTVKSTNASDSSSFDYFILECS